MLLLFVCSEGVREIWLTSEDLGAYGHDIGVRLPELLWQLVEVIPDGAMMRLGMTNPPYILEHLEVCLQWSNLDKALYTWHCDGISRLGTVLNLHELVLLVTLRR